MTRKRRNITYKDWITEEGLIKLEGMARDGLINEEIANQIGIHPSTLYDWQSKHPEIADALKRGKEVVDRQVENALLKRALGYEYEEEKIYINKQGDTVTTRKEVHKKKMAPDVTAQIFWLKNRKWRVWRDRRDIELEGNLNVEQREEVKKLTTKELETLAKQIETDKK